MATLKSTFCIVSHGNEASKILMLVTYFGICIIYHLFAVVRYLAKATQGFILAHSLRRDTVHCGGGGGEAW